MGGKSAPFGIDEECLESALEAVISKSELELAGIHLFTGTQILDVDVLLSQYRKGLDIGRRVARNLGRPLRTIDLGGGLGIPYFANEAPLDLEGFCTGLNRMMADVREDELLEGTRFVLEPGRFLVGEAGLYVTRIVDVKVSRGKKFLIVDGGMNHHLAASGNLGQTIKRNYPVAILNKLDIPIQGAVDVVGPLCTPLDVLARGVQLPPGDIGDLLGIFQSGAYARSASPLGFLSHPTPPEVLVSVDGSQLIRQRGGYDCYLADQHPLDP
jgi:diaminopimelate decarboxylase